MIMKIIPTCRYNHGILEEIQGDPAQHYSLPAVAKTHELSGKVSVVETPIVFMVRLFRCPMCGYLEIFDNDR